MLINSTFKCIFQFGPELDGFCGKKCRKTSEIKIAQRSSKFLLVDEVTILLLKKATKNNDKRKKLIKTLGK